jgi:colanic acid biosynthesis glycosyl transferase WcaI
MAKSNSPETLADTRSSPSRRPDLAADSAATQIIFINRFFYPDHSATSQILTDLAIHRATARRPVRVITSRQRYDDPQASLPEQGTVSGVVVNRVSTTRFGRTALIGRGFDYLSFYVSVWRSILALAQPGAILVAKTDPPLLSIPALHAVRRRGLRLVNWLQDLYPEVATELGVPLVRGPIASALARLRDVSLRAADANVVVGERMAALVCARGVDATRVQVIPNWCDDEEIRPVASVDNPLRREWGLNGCFVVGYSGNLGRGHEFETILGAAEQLRHEPHIVFLFIGGGQKIDELVSEVHKRNLASAFRFLPYQERTALKYSLTVPDIHWVSLKPELEGLIVPSKFYGIAAAGRPIIAIAAGDGEIAHLVRRHRCGIVVEPGASNVLAEQLRHLSADGGAVDGMGFRARRMLEEHFTRRQAFAAWDRLLDGIIP